MPLFNSCPLGASSDEYSAYIDRNASIGVACFVPSNSFERINYKENTKSIPGFVKGNAERVRDIVRSMVVDN